LNHKGKILVIDDEEDILEILKVNFEKEGYEVATAVNGKLGLEIAIKYIPQVIFIDVMMPVMDGIETCLEIRKIKELNQTMICFLSAREEDYTQIAALNAGADDYMMKPIRIRVLLSKLEALMRREKKSEDPPVFSGYILNKEKYLIIKDSQEFKLPRKQFELLSLLLSKPGKVFRREEIMDTIWGSETIVGDRTIDVHIRKIREVLVDMNIETIKGIGYKLTV
jgi:two-component system, OmpR family, alkaline phosphatase synthesis response regulator PhoP